MSRENVMKEELSTENGLLIGFMARILKPIFLEDARAEHVKARLKFTRKIIAREQAFYNLPGATDRVLRKHSLGVLLYQFVIYEHHKTQKSKAAHHYVTQDITDRQMGKTIVPKETVKQTIWDLYDPDFTGTVDLSLPQFREATTGLDLTVQMKKTDYDQDYFTQNSRYQETCGKFNERSNSIHFFLRVKNLFRLHDDLADIGSGEEKSGRVGVSAKEESNDWGISAQEYKQFKLFELLPDIKPAISEFVQAQLQHLDGFLDRFNEKPIIAEMLRTLKKLCWFFAECAPEDRPYLRQLIEWEFQRMQVGLVSGAVPTLRSLCFQTLLPEAAREIKSPTREDLETTWDDKASVAKIPQGVFGKTLPQRCGELYFLHSGALKMLDQEATFASQVEVLEKELKDETNESTFLEKESQIMYLQQMRVKVSTEKMNINPQELDKLTEKFFLILMQESYNRRLAATVSLPTMKELLEKQLKIVRDRLAELERAEKLPAPPQESADSVGEQFSAAASDQPSPALAPEPDRLPSAVSRSTRRVSVLKRWTHDLVPAPAEGPAPQDAKQRRKPDPVSASSQDAKQPRNNPGQLRVSQLTTVGTVLAAGRERARPLEAPQPAAPRAPSTLVFVLPPLPTAM